jgi:hypothetical protein
MTATDHFYAYLFGENTLVQITEKQEGELKGLTGQTTTVIVMPQNTITVENLAQLDKIIAACRLSKAEILVVNEQIKWQQLRQLDNIKYLILFGINCADFGVNIKLPLHYPLQFDERTWIVAADFNVMLTQPNLKAELWNKALKPTFAP